MKICKIFDCTKPVSKWGLCQMHNWRLRVYGDTSYERPKSLCSIEGCSRPRKRYRLCQLHSRRKKSGLPFDYERPKLASKRYKIVKRPGHPLAGFLDRVYEHRAVLFDSLGWLRVPCFWCPKPVSFATELIVDHLDHNRHNNSLNNLVPSCISCNAGRTRANPRVRKPSFRPLDQFVWTGTNEQVGS